MNSEKKVAVVTGAASGIGKATANAFAQAGFRVFGLDIDAQGAARVEAEFLQRYGKGAFSYVEVDLSQRTSILQASQSILNQVTAVDAIVNAAGWDRIEPFVNNTPEFMDKVIQINLMGPMTLTKALLPSMIQAGSGKIVNVASDAGRVGSMGETVYAAAKGGMIAFTKSLAREMSRYQIHVNCVCPGPTDTPLFHAQPDKLKEALLKAIPFKRLAKPEETASAILFFATDKSDYVTAQVMSVSGGLTMVG
jgi:2-hydroxycyclohexanecarboxyl-CoA dehydrogenase